MTSPYGDKRLCTTLPVEELEDTFFYPGPTAVSEAPSALAQRHWDRAREICLNCPVFLRCGDENMGQEFGVYAATDQHERYRLRKRLTAALRKTDGEQREALAKTLAERAGGAEAARAETLAWSTGYSVQTVRVLIAEHRERVSAQRQERRDTTAREAVDVPLPAGIVWPEADPPEGDGWVRSEGQTLPGYYLAQTPDGVWLRMKFRAGHLTPVRKWFPAERVSVRAVVEPVFENWSGEGKANAA
jgi:hypothetical protein